MMIHNSCQKFFLSKFTIVGHDCLSEEIDKLPLYVNDKSSNIDSDYKLQAVSFLQVKNNTKVVWHHFALEGNLLLEF